MKADPALPPFPADELGSAAVVAQAIFPAARDVRAADEVSVEEAYRFVGQQLPQALLPFRLAHKTLHAAARAVSGRPLERLSALEKDRVIHTLTRTPGVGQILRQLSVPYRITHCERPGVLADAEAETADKPGRPLPIASEQPRWARQVIPARALDPGDDIECDVVVVGTGAGGAVVGRHLTDHGLAVVFVEAGELAQRHEFRPEMSHTAANFWQTTLTLGNAPLIVPQGRLLGGSTAVNGGTSLRPPPWVTDKWCEELGSAEFSSEALTPYFERTEQILQVEPPSLAAAGRPHALASQGAAALGWHHDLIPRNAPGCQGDGFCDHGCASGARRSTEISYLPTALERGALVLTGLRADRLLHDGGRAVGLEGTALERSRETARDAHGRPRRVRIRARAVVLAAGSFGTPTFLLKQELFRDSSHLGRHLTLHPSGATVGLFDETIDCWKAIPQATYSREFLRKGVLLNTAGPTPALLPLLLPQIGRELAEIVAARRNIMATGYLCADRSRGRIRLGPGGRPITTYNIGSADVALLQQAVCHTAELLLAAGAKEVYPGVFPAQTLRSRADVNRLASGRLSASDFLIASYHPLGTCRMSRSATDGVIGLDHEAHELPGLFVVDGSAVRGPLGVNPQITIMALATRAAEKIAEKLS